MTLLTYKETDFQKLPDQPRLRAIFNVARNITEADIVSNAAQKALLKAPSLSKRTQESIEQNFALWMDKHKIITSLPDLSKRAMTRVIGLSMIERSALTANRPIRIRPEEVLAEMRLATTKSPQVAFFHAAIAEQETFLKSGVWPAISVAQTEYDIIDTKNSILRLPRCIEKAEQYKALNRDTVHEVVYNRWVDLISGFGKFNGSKIPPNLYKQAKDSIEKLSLLVPNFKPTLDLHA